MEKRSFEKTYKTPLELISILKSRGLIIDDEQKAQLYLESIGYFRLSAYMHPLLKVPKYLHQYKSDATFSKVLMLYSFDKKLRLFLFNEIEKIEIAIREAVINIAAEKTGDIYWLTNLQHFRNHSIFNNSLDILSKEYERSTEDFIDHFKRTYKEPFPPVWILGELLPMGSINIYYRNLKNKTLKKQIAKRFKLHAPVLESWLSVLTLTRNACCHHSRVWNKINKIVPNDMKGMTQPWITLSTDKRKVYYNICIIKYFIDIISPENDMLDKMNALFNKFPEIDLSALGFPKGWENEPLWSNY